MTTIAFRINKASLRGTEVAIYDYADANENILGNRSIIVIQESRDHNLSVIAKFVSRFTVYFYDPNNLSDLESIMIDCNCKILYTIGYGSRAVNDPTLSPNGIYKTALHCVFTMIDPHADTYIPISEYLAKKYSYTTYVPHIISLPNIENHINMKSILNIPSTDLVFGRHGGYETFNIQFVHQAIFRILNLRKDVWFLFINTKEFYNHPRVIYLNPIVDKLEKVKFINTCDAMIHARLDGETFGIACGEFSILNKPVITHRTIGDTAHIDILGDKCLTYTTEDEVLYIFQHFESIKTNKEKTNHCEKHWDAYSESYNSVSVILDWWKYLIEPLV